MGHDIDAISNIYTENVLCEGVTVRPQDADIAKGYDTIFSLAYHVYWDHIDDMVKKMGADTSIAVDRQLLASDGTDGDNKKEGIINFYTVNLDPDQIVKTMAAIDYWVGEYGGTIEFLRKDAKSGMCNSPVIRLQATVAPPDLKEIKVPEVSMSNATADHIFHNILNFSETEGHASEGRSFSIADLALAIATAQNYGSQKPVAPTKGKNWYDGGISQERIDDVLGQLESMVDYCEKNSYSFISVA